MNVFYIEFYNLLKKFGNMLRNLDNYHSRSQAWFKSGSGYANKVDILWLGWFCFANFPEWRSSEGIAVAVEGIANWAGGKAVAAVKAIATTAVETVRTWKRAGCKAVAVIKAIAAAKAAAAVAKRGGGERISVVVETIAVATAETVVAGKPVVAVAPAEADGSTAVAKCIGDGVAVGERISVAEGISERTRGFLNRHHYCSENKSLFISSLWNYLWKFNICFNVEYTFEPFNAKKSFIFKY